MWTRTHRMGGYLFTTAGVLTLLAALLPRLLAVAVLVVSGAAASLGSIVYSYIAWREEHE